MNEEGDLAQALRASIQQRVTLVNLRSGSTVELSVLRVYSDQIRIEWPMAGVYELTLAGGVWKSMPRKLFQNWRLSAESALEMEELIVAERERRIEEMQRRKQVV